MFIAHHVGPWAFERAISTEREAVMVLGETPNMGILRIEHVNAVFPYCPIITQ